MEVLSAWICKLFLFANRILLLYPSHSVNTGQDCSDDVCLLSKKRKKNECEMMLVAWKSIAFVHQWSFCRLLCLVLLLFSMLFYIKRHTEHKNCVTAEEMIVYFLSGLSHELFSWCLEANLCLNYPLCAQAVHANVLKNCIHRALSHSELLYTLYQTNIFMLSLFKVPSWNSWIMKNCENVFNINVREFL